MGDKSLDLRHHPVLAVISNCYSEPKGRFPRVTHPCATKPEGFVRLACVRHAASVRSEPGSNSQVETAEAVSLTSNLRTSASPRRKKSLPIANRSPTTGEADNHIIGRSLVTRYANDPRRNFDQTARISLQISINFKELQSKNNQLANPLAIQPSLPTARPSVPGSPSRPPRFLSSAPRR